MFVKRLPVGQKVGDRFIMTFGLKTDPPQKHLVVVLIQEQVTLKWVTSGHGKNH